MPRTSRRSRLSTSLEEDANSFQTKYLQKKNYDLARKLSEMEAKYHAQVLENQLLQAQCNASLLNGIKRAEIQILVKNCWTSLTSFTNEFTKLSKCLLDETNALNKAEDCTVSPRRHPVVPVTVEPVARTPNLKAKETRHTPRAAPELDGKDTQQDVPLHNVAATSEAPKYLDVTPENALPAQDDLGSPVTNSPNVASPLTEGTHSERMALSTIREETLSAFIEKSHASHRHDNTISAISFETSCTSTPMKDPEYEDGRRKPIETPNRSQFVNKRRGATSIKMERLSTPRVLLERIDVTKYKRSSCSTSKTEATPGKENADPGSPVRRRRAASKPISYAEPPLKKKLRRLT